MRYLIKLCHRSFASSRLNSAVLSSRAELNFKESNDFPSPYQVIDQNTCSLENRLSISESRRLKEQIALDEAELVSFSSRNIPCIDKDIAKGSNILEFTYQVSSDFPGVNCPSELLFDAALEVRIPISDLGLSAPELNKIAKVLKSNENYKYLEYSVSSFPFLSQNKIEASKILNALISFAKSTDSASKEFLSHILLDKESIKEHSNTIKCEKNLEFPSDWLRSYA